MNYIISEAFNKLKALEEGRFSYDKEQEFTSKSTAHGNGVANKGMGRVPALFKNIRNWKPGTAYFDVYVGSGAGAGTGQGRPTGGDKYQTFMKLEDYAEEIGEVFGQDNVEVKGKLIVATK